MKRKCNKLLKQFNQLKQHLKIRNRSFVWRRWKTIVKLTTASNQKGKKESESNEGNNEGSSENRYKEEERRAKIAEDKFKVALKEEMGEGLINIDRQDDKVIITVDLVEFTWSVDLTSKAKK